MEKEKIIKFIHLFDSLNSATYIIDKSYHPDKYANLVYDGDDYNDIKEIKLNLKKMIYLIDHKHPLFVEIENNLSNSSPEQRLIYLRDILRKFVNIAPFFNLKLVKRGNFYFENQKKCASLFRNIEHHMDILEASIDLNALDEVSLAKRYIFNTYNLFFDFSHYLDALCLNFDIDIVAIQKNMDIRVYTEEDRMHDILEEMGDGDKLNRTINSGETTFDQFLSIFKSCI